ncbi:Down syndrome cell adhesion molecule-like protein Dscam2 [Araneus ventricosus]|uniref:Down syndrome cell adhesion molecule-like protein Dscam2 n=1 Tax=Araneus ventricosus TaxID=182803 RepID=A0A4Y2HWX0_ARAVE|nr:Down syndrome cell adhesion molecule-like protein Dscam2 [Araneus ventricosus]
MCAVLSKLVLTHFKGFALPLSKLSKNFLFSFILPLPFAAAVAEHTCQLKRVSVRSFQYTKPHHNQPPRIIRRSSRVKATNGHRATLTCIAQGYPVPAYRWHRSAGGQRILSDLDASVRQEGGVLIFNKVSRGDAGRYSCHVSNAVGEDRADMELLVEEPLRVNLSPQELKLDVGKSALFNCSVEGHPIGNVVWKKDTRFIASNSRVQFPTPTSLQLRQLKRQDSGMYQCFVHRESLSSQAAARLIIGGESSNSAQMVLNVDAGNLDGKDVLMVYSKISLFGMRGKRH